MRPVVSGLLLSLCLSSASPAAAAASWPDLAGRVGPYGGADYPLGNAAQNAEAMARDGFNLALVPYQGDFSSPGGLQGPRYQVYRCDDLGLPVVAVRRAVG